MNAIPFTLALSLAASAACSAQAHVTIEPREAPAGSTQVVRLRVGHGCHESGATTALRVKLPAGVASARPQPKPGWSLSIEHGASGAVTAVTWTGLLPGDQFDDFALLVRLPAVEGPVYFPAVQTCGREEERWMDTPEPGAETRALAHPAPSVRLGTAPPEGGHHH
jgi:uncharacterized protein YcnI